MVVCHRSESWCGFRLVVRRYPVVGDRLRHGLRGIVSYRNIHAIQIRPTWIRFSYVTPRNHTVRYGTTYGTVRYGMVCMYGHDI